ncbi:ABC-three component system protein [Streptomyces sp. NPDC002619]|uniref:ABC-three component system protein n=1 Tax=Streptomyces sp. NPDC002619 TaxID=3364655 RepID=UPI0036CDF093
MAERGPDFEASASALGYVYQLREALYLCVSRLGNLDWSLAIEAGDDIEEVRRDGRTYYQLKHRAPGTRMTNASVDLWKTLRIWAHGIAHGQLDLDETDLILLTTAGLPDGSVGSMLQSEESRQRDEQSALEALKATRGASKSDALTKAFAAFDLLTGAQLERMVSKIQVIGNAPDVDAVERKLRQAAVTAVGREHATSFLIRLEGWFFRRSIQQLRAGSLDAITGLDFDAVFSDLRNQFGRANLPIDEDIAEMQADLAKHAGHPFVRQLELIELGSSRVNRAVRDYMRAFSQRSRWLNENLLLPKEISRYERRLIEEWQELFDDMVDILGAEAAEAEKVAAARNIYRWAMTEAQRRIRPECDEPFVAKGSFHILADDYRVGWHMDFLARLMAVLEPVETASS